MLRTGTLSELVEAVERHYAESEDALHLSRLGQTLVGLNYRGFGGLAAAIAEIGPERLTIINPTGVIGAEVVVLPGRLEEQVARSQEGRAARRQAAEAFDTLPVPVRLAFCAGVQGDQIALRISPPFRYRRLVPGTQAGPGELLVDDRFRHPGLNLRSASEAERALLWECFSAWASAHALQVGDFRSEVWVCGPRGSAFDRFMSEQDPEIRARIRMPDDIAELLRARK